MSIVYVTQDVEGRNFLPAMSFGELEVLMPSGAQVILDAGPTLDTINRKLQKMRKEDYLLLSGDPIIIGLSIAVGFLLMDGKLTVLKWDRQQKKYYKVKIDFYGGPDDGS